MIAAHLGGGQQPDIIFERMKPHERRTNGVVVKAAMIEARGEQLGEGGLRNRRTVGCADGSEKRTVRNVSRGLRKKDEGDRHSGSDEATKQYGEN